MKKGFTLMEILAVLLVLAVIASFAIPVVKSFMDEVNYRKAQVAASKLAEAVRTFYRESKGYKIGGAGVDDTFVGMDVVTFKGECTSPALSGVPAFELTSSPGGMGVEQLFLCEYLPAKDFAGLKYKFEVRSVSETCLIRAWDLDENPNYNASDSHAICVK